jgi:hypothetical protein
MKTIEKSKGLSAFFDNYPLDMHIRIYSKGSISGLKSGPAE